MDFIDGVRITLQDMRKTLEGGEAVVLVAVDGDTTVGCVKIEQLETGESEIGMFAVDPDYQSCGVGAALLNAAHQFAEEVLDAKQTVMMVLDNRQDIIGWYQTYGYKLTDDTAPFPEPSVGVGIAKQPLTFVRLRRFVPSR
jgi:ribosomal protein S18 acetylase RimI-like enzyme